MSVFQWTGSNAADLGNAANWVDVSNPGSPPQEPGANDTAIIEVGQGLYGTLSVAALDLVQASGAPSLSITGGSTQAAGSVGIAGAFTLDTGAYLQAGSVGIDGGSTAVTVQNNAFLNIAAGMNDVSDIGASTGSAALLFTEGGYGVYNSYEGSGELDLGGVSNSSATLSVTDGGSFYASLDNLNIGAASGATGILNVVGAGSEFTEDNYGYTTIGDYGGRGGSAQGTVEVTGGGYVSLSSAGVNIGTTAGMAEILVSGANSEVEAGGSVEIGSYQENVAGEIIVRAGGDFETGTDAYVNRGTISVSGANSLFTARDLLVYDGTTAAQVSNGGYVHVQDLYLSGKFVLSAGNVNARGGILLYGTGDAVGHGTITAASIHNFGLIVASGGTLTLDGSISGTGVLQIASGAALHLDNAVDNTLSILFGANANKLLLADPSGVAAHILDFATGDAIDLLGIAATKLSYAAGALTVSNGTTLVAKLEVRGHYTTANFKLVSDGHSGSLISYVAGTTNAGPLPIGQSFSSATPFAHHAI